MIVIPDIHGRSFWRYAADEFAGREHIVFLGDYLDPYPDEGISNEAAFGQLQDIVKLKEEHPDDITLLLGNHDLHYIHAGATGSRFDAVHASRNRRVFEQDSDLFQMAFEAEIGNRKYLFTHAGILQGWMQANGYLFGAIEPKDLVNYLNAIWWMKDTRHILLEALSDVSYARWGTSRYGSMVWADVTEHSADHVEIPGYYQVFGHTIVLEPVITPCFACIDCQMPFTITEDGDIGPLYY